jgi:mannobiose 2-epimerase
MKNEIVNELINHILPFWMNLIDKENGGFYGEVRYDLTINKEGNKGGIATARILWTFSSAYNVTKDKVYLEYAKQSYDFLINKVYDSEYKGLYWMLDYKGNVCDSRKHIYTQAFGIYALSEYYKATGEKRSLEIARELYELIETKGYNEVIEAYKEEFDNKWNETDNEMLSENGVIATITTNTHLHVMEAYTNLYRVWDDSELRNKLTKLIYTFYEKIYDKKTKYQKIFFDGNWNSIIDLKSFGHDIEASWLIDEAVKVLNLKDNNISNMIVDIAYNIAENAVMEDGSVINEQEGSKIDFTRVWWVQCEAIVGFFNAYERTHDEKFSEKANNTWKYIKNKIVDKRTGGEWYWSIEPNGEATERNIVEPWKLSYHNSRACLQMIERMS